MFRSELSHLICLHWFQKSHTITEAFGGGAVDGGIGIAVDARGNAYVIGSTTSNDFPTLYPIQPTPVTPSLNAFVSKLNADGSGLVYSTHLGGSATDFGEGIALDIRGNAYVVGSTSSADFPTTPEAFQREIRDAIQDAFITKVGNLRYRFCSYSIGVLRQKH
jgi:Beta-propeller repeat